MSLRAPQFIWSIVAVLVCLALLGSTAVSVFAQGTGDDDSVTTIVATTTESKTETGSEQVTPLVTESWYKSDFLTGDNIALGDFVIGPGKIEVTVKPGETVTKMISVANRIADNKTFSLSVEDMSGSADPSQSVVLLGDVAGPYTLRDNISFPKDTFTLKLGERAQIPVSITMPENAEPGGYYGSVLISTVQNGDNKEGSSASSPIIARIGTLFFITVPGDFKSSGAVTDFSTIPKSSLFTSGPLKLGVLFENTGSVHLNPYGSVSIKNTFGEEVGFVEIEPWFVLPQSLRLRELVWDREWLLGRYTLTAEINRGYDNIIDTKVIHIWVLPWQFMLGLLASIIFIFSIIKFISNRFEFKRKPVN